MLKRDFVKFACAAAIVLGASALPAAAQSRFAANVSAAGPFKVGNAVKISANVTNNGGAINNLIMDMGVYSARGLRVGQGNTRGCCFTAGQSKSYNWNWVPTAPGTYTVRFRVFNADWSSLYFCSMNATTITVN